MRNGGRRPGPSARPPAHSPRAGRPPRGPARTRTRGAVSAASRPWLRGAPAQGPEGTRSRRGPLPRPARRSDVMAGARAVPVGNFGRRAQGFRTGLGAPRGWSCCARSPSVSTWSGPRSAQPLDLGPGRRKRRYRAPAARVRRERPCSGWPVLLQELRLHTPTTYWRAVPESVGKATCRWKASCGSNDHLSFNGGGAPRSGLYLVSHLILTTTVQGRHVFFFKIFVMDRIVSPHHHHHHSYVEALM